MESHLFTLFLFAKRNNVTFIFIIKYQNINQVIIRKTYPYSIIFMCRKEQKLLLRQYSIKNTCTLEYNRPENFKMGPQKLGSIIYKIEKKTERINRMPRNNSLGYRTKKVFFNYAMHFKGQLFINNYSYST